MYTTYVCLYIQVDCVTATQRVSADQLYFECEGLSPETTYNISVWAENGAGVSPAVATSVTTTCSPTSSLTQEGEGGVVSVVLGDSCSIRCVNGVSLTSSALTPPILCL